MMTGRWLFAASLLPFSLAFLAGPAAAETLADVVQGAKKEKTIRASINSELGQKGIARLKKEIQQEFGVDLDIRYTPVGSYPKRLADLIAEMKSGIPPSYDLTQFSDNVLVQAREANVIAPVSWREILAPGTPRDAAVDSYDSLHLYDSHIGMIYNTDLVRDQDVPRTLQQLGDPKWKDKLTAHFYTSTYLTYLYILGTDKALAALQAMRSNNTVFDSYAANVSRFTSGEYPIQLTSSGFLGRARARGINARWVSLDFSFNTKHVAVVARGARSPNAAKLVAVYLAGPKGNRILQELTYVGNADYAGHLGHEIQQQDAKAGLKAVNPISDAKLIRFVLSPEGRELDKRIGAIIFRK